MTANGQSNKRTDAPATAKAGEVRLTGTQANASDHQTWRDWIPPDMPEPDRLVTRPQLLDRLSALGFDVEERTLMSWEAAGVLPRAVRRWQDGRPHALYPEGWESAVWIVLDQQDSGYSLSQIAEIIRQLPFSALVRRDWVQITGQRARDAIEAYATEIERITRQPVRGFKLVLVDYDGEEVPGGFQEARISIPTPKSNDANESNTDM